MLWILGAKGLLGSALSAKCKAALHLPPGVPKDASSLGSCIAALHSGREVDICDLEALRAFVKANPGIREIVNCAAFSLVDPAETEREQAWRLNAVGPGNLVQVAKEIGARLVHLSTDYVFSGEGRVPLKETDPVAPCNYYGMSKLEGERRALAGGACVIRTSWLFGGGGKNFVARVFAMLQNQEEVRLTNDQWGRPTYVEDLADAILQLKGTGLYQYANQGVTTRYEFGMAVKEIMEAKGLKTARIKAVSSSEFVTPCKRPVYSAFNTEKIEQYVAIRHWKEALTEFLCARQTASL
jgi:dTDP-4-dehydrorhamnose reductase